jgi:hypothetical protein
MTGKGRNAGRPREAEAGEHAPGVRLAEQVLAASLGALVVGTAVVVGAAVPPPQPSETLTRMGLAMVRPENEMRAYVAGVLVALLFYAAFAARVRRRRGRPLPAAFSWAAAVLAWTIAGALLHPYLRGHRHLAAALAPHGLAAPALVLLGTVLGVWALMRWLPPRLLAPRLPLRGTRIPAYVFDTVFVVGVTLAVSVWPIGLLASRVYVNERFFHWEHFLFTPALGVMNGLRLGVDLYSQYGVAWPTLYGWLAGATGWGYPQALFLASAAGVAYYLFAYLFLRAVTGQRVAAALGVVLLLALYQYPWTFFHTRTYTVWQIPSATLLRAPLDLAVILALWRYSVSARRRWFIVAGALTGMSLTIAADMGVLLAALTAACAGVCAWRRVRAGGWAALPRQGLAWGVAAALAVGVPAMAYGAAAGVTNVSDPLDAATRAAAGITASAVGGVGATHLLARIHTFEWLYFLGMVAVYLAAAGAWLGRSWAGKPVHPFTAAAGLLGLYGLMRGMFFAWNTVPQVLMRGTPALGLILALWLADWRRRGPAQAPNGRGLPRRTLAVAWVLGGACALLALNPSFRDYPSLLRHLTGRSAHAAGVLVPGPAPGIPVPPAWRPHAEEVRAGLAACTALAEAGARAVILHDHSTFYHWYSGLPLWGDNPNVYYLMYTQSQLEAFLSALDGYAPDYVLIARDVPGDSLAPLYADVHRRLRAHVEARYRSGGEVGVFTVFRRPGHAPLIPPLTPPDTADAADGGGRATVRQGE